MNNFYREKNMNHLRELSLSYIKNGLKLFSHNKINFNFLDKIVDFRENLSKILSL